MNYTMTNCIENCPKCKNMVSMIPDIYGKSYLLDCKYQKHLISVMKDTFCAGGYCEGV